MADWKKLSHAHGPATRVPIQIAALSDKDETTAQEALSTLLDTMVGKGEWFSASAPAAAAILDALPKATRKDWLLALLADVVGGDHVRAWLSPAEEKNGPPKEVVAAVLERKAAILELAKAKDPTVRAAVYMALATVPALASEGRAVALLAAENDKEEVVRASAILALGRLGGGDPVFRPKGAGLVRGASALSLLRADASVSFEESVEGLAAWLGWRPVPEGRAPRLPWFGGLATLSYRTRNRLAPAAAGLAAVARKRRQEGAAIDVALKIGGGDASGDALANAGEVALELGGFYARFREEQWGSVAVVATAEELGDIERGVAKKLAGSALLPRAGFGLPASGEVRRRWIGLAPPSGLERDVSVKVDGKARSVPFWKAWNLLDASMAGGRPIPPAIDGDIAGVDRWQALVEFGAGSYGGAYQVIDDVDAELSKLKADAAFFARAARVADDLALRFAAADRIGAPIERSYITGTLLFLPFVRHKKVIRPEWDVLVYVGYGSEPREVLEAVPAARRPAIVARHLPKEGMEPGDISEALGQVIPMLDLAPTKPIAEIVAKHLE